MKNKIILLFALLLVFVSCKKNSQTSQDSVINKDIYGIWQRDFEPMPNATHHVEYTIDKDSVSYSLHGAAVNLDYKTAIDTITKENRIISHRDGVYYVMFVEPYSQDSIEIFKETKKDFQEALNFPKPDKDYKANHNQGWNMYYKK